MATVPAQTTTYTLEQAEEDIAQLRGQVDLGNEAQTILDGAVVPNTPAASGVTLYSAAAQLNYASFDGNEYNTGRLTLVMTGSATIASTSPVVISGGGVALSTAIVAGTYLFRAHLMYVGNGTGAASGNGTFRMTGPAFSSGSVNLVGTANGLTSVRFDNASGFGNNLQGPLVSTGDTTTRFDAVIEGSAVFTAPGTLAVQGLLLGTGSNANFTVAAGSTFELFPVT